MHTNSRNTWYGVEDSTFVSHGEWPDGEIYFDYQGEQYVINASDAEQWLWDDFKDYCQENNLNPDEHINDEIWKNFASSEAYDVLLNLGPYNESYEMNESKKRKVKLTESQLHRVIKESVKRVLKENALSKNAADVLRSCNRNLSAVLQGIKNDFAQVYGMLRDGVETEEDFHKVIYAYRDLMDNFANDKYLSQISNAYEPITKAFINSNLADDDKFYKPEDWHERNEHGDFDTF